MAFADTLCKKQLNAENTVVESHDFYTDKNDVVHLKIKARSDAWHIDDCPGYNRPQ